MQSRSDSGTPVVKKCDQGQTVPFEAGPRLQQLPKILLAAITTIGLVAVSAALLPQPELLYIEDGILEQLSVLVWTLSVLCGLGNILSGTQKPEKMLASWLALMALLAAARELDAHVYLNPQHLGDWGVRYRISWWLSGEVSIWLKLGWIVILLSLLFALIRPVFSFAGPLWKLLKIRDTAAVLLAVAFPCLGMGFVMDDLFRNSPLMSMGVRQCIEETAETLGALSYLASLIAFRWTSASKRIAMS